MKFLDADGDASALPLAIGRLAWAGPLTVATSIAAVHAVRQLVIRMPGVRVQSGPLGAIADTVDTAILCTLAVALFALICAFHDDAIRRFRWIAFGALLISFLPLIGGAGNARTALGVATMHIAAYLPCVIIPPWATSGRRPPS
jgi:hypothetical protein